MSRKQPKIEVVVQDDDGAEFYYGSRRNAYGYPHLLVYAMTFGQKNRVKYASLLFHKGKYGPNPRVLHLCNFFIYRVLNHALNEKPIPDPTDLRGTLNLLKEWQILIEEKLEKLGKTVELEEKQEDIQKILGYRSQGFSFREISKKMEYSPSWAFAFLTRHLDILDQITSQEHPAVICKRRKCRYWKTENNCTRDYIFLIFPGRSLTKGPYCDSFQYYTE